MVALLEAGVHGSISLNCPSYVHYKKLWIRASLFLKHELYSLKSDYMTVISEIFSPTILLATKASVKSLQTFCWLPCNGTG